MISVIQEWLREHRLPGREVPLPEISHPVATVDEMRVDTKIDYRHVIAHTLAIGILIFLFGTGVYSLSIDVAHHFLLIDALSKGDAARLTTIPAMEGMAHYPPGAHWLAAGLGVLIGSPYAAMWLLALLSVYAAYYALGRLVQLGRGYITLAVFAVMVLLLRSTGALTGYEIIGNFFFAQLVGTAILFMLLVGAGYVARWRDEALMALALVAAAGLMYVHLLPGLELLGTVGFALFFSLAIRFFKGEPVLRKSIELVFYGIAATALTVLHPAFAEMRQIAANNGNLMFPINVNILFVSSIMVAVVSTWGILRRGRGHLNSFDLIVAAAMCSSITLMLLQLLALLTVSAGSPYAVKKHLLVVVPLVVVGATRAMTSSASRKRVASQHSPIGAIIVAVLATWWLYPDAPLQTIQQVTAPLGYAQNAVLTGLPRFQPGNTAIFASSVDPVSRYMIDLSVFRMPFLDGLGLLTGKTTDPSRYAYVMYDRNDPQVALCSERFFETSRYVFVPGKCLSTISIGWIYPPNGAGSAISFSGWSRPEATHRWSIGDESSITLSHIPKTKGKLCLYLNGFTLGPQTITASIRGSEVYQTTLNGAGTVRVPLGQNDSPVTVTLAFSNPHKPGNGDSRILAFAIKNMSINACAQ